MPKPLRTPLGHDPLENMTYSLHTLHAKTVEPPTPEPVWVRLGGEAALFFGFFAVLFCLLALAT